MSLVSSPAPTASELAPAVRARLNLPPLAELELEPIEKGGSDRAFFRVRGAAGGPFILARYGPSRPENARQGDITAFLDAKGVRVPHVLFHDRAAGLLGLEDFGGRDLWSFRERPWRERRPLYEAALREVRRIHALTPADAAAWGMELELQFDAALYRWEQHYFFEHALDGLWADRVPVEERARLAIRPEWDRVAVELAAKPRVLVHRDFQSQNVMILPDGRAGLIDFQGLRGGLAAYDLASLLYDPYVTLAESEREELLAFYHALPGAARGEGFAREFALCAMQRLMQALGAYGNLGLNLGKKGFLAHVPVAAERLRAVAQTVPEGAALAEVLRKATD